MKKYPATFFLIVVSVAVQCLAARYPGLIEGLAFSPSASVFGWLVGIVTYQVDHAGWGHLLGNFCFALPYMLFLEGKLGRKRFLEFYLICGMGSAILQQLMMPPLSLIGSSGSLFGVAMGACLAFGEDKREHVLGLLLLVVLFIPQLMAAPYAALTGIAVYGHIGGALMGMLLSQRLYRTQCT